MLVVCVGQALYMTAADHWLGDLYWYSVCAKGQMCRMLIQGARSKTGRCIHVQSSPAVHAVGSAAPHCGLGP